MLFRRSSYKTTNAQTKQTNQTDAFPIVDDRRSSLLILLYAHVDPREAGPYGSYVRVMTALSQPFPLALQCRFFFDDNTSHDVKTEKKLLYDTRLLAGYVK